MKYDDIAIHLGEFGWFQKKVFYLLIPAGMSCGIQIMISVFNIGTPDHRCAIPGYPGDTWDIQSPEHERLINATIPWDPESADGEGGYSRCRVYFHDNFTQETTQKACSSFVYDPSTYASSVVTKWDLVCQKTIYRSHSRMIVMGGLLVGAFATGIIADIIGRKLALMCMVALQAASSIAVCWAPSFVAYCILRFLTGFTISGLFLVIFVLSMELVGPSKRMFVGIVVEIFWSAGVMLLGGIAYGVRDWDKLQMIVSFPILLMFAYWWLIPQSPRWLMARGRLEEAKVIIRKAAEVNKVTLPEKVLESMEDDNANGEEEKFWHIFKCPVLILRTLILCLNWLVCSMVFYGLSLNSGNLGGSVYVNFQLMALCEVLAYVMCVLLLNRLGRKIMHIACMMLGGGACISTIFSVLYASPGVQAWLTITLALVGKLGAAAAFAVIYVYSAELFPTLLRNSLMGLVCLFARLGGMISPYIADLNSLVGGKFGRALPLLVFGSATIAAGLLCVFLPETLHKHLPETLEDARKFGRKLPRHLRRPGHDGERRFSMTVEVDPPQSAQTEMQPLTPNAKEEEAAVFITNEKKEKEKGNINNNNDDDTGAAINAHCPKASNGRLP